MDITTQNLSDNKQASIVKIDGLNDKTWANKYTDARASLENAQTALNLSREIGYKKGEAYALRNMGACQWLLSEYENGIRNAEISLRLFEELRDSFGLAHAMNLLGNINEKTGNHAQALDFFTRSLKIREEIDDSEGAATSLNNIGNVYFSFGRLADALDCYLKSLHFQEEVGNQAGISRSLNNIGNIYARLGEYDRAFETLNRSLELKRKIGDRINEGKVLLNMGDANIAIENYEQALELYLQSLRMAQTTGDRITETAALGSIGQIYQHMGDYDKALVHHEKCLKAAREIGVKYNEAEALINLGDVYIKRKQFDAGAECLDQALTLTDELRANELIQRIHRVLSESYEAQGQLDLALRHYKLFHQTFRRVFGEETEQKVKSLSVRFEIEKAQKEAEIHRLRNVELAQANEALRNANQFKMEILNIAAHDLKNPLQAILGYSELITQDSETDSSITEWAKEIFSSSQRMIGLINAMLYQASLENGQLKLETKEIAVETIARKCVEQNRTQASLKGQTINFNADIGCFARADKQRLSEAFDNLISNAIKYSEYDKQIHISIKQQDNIILFTIKDEGPGLTDEDKTKLFQKFQRLSAFPTGGESSTRLGLSITKLLVELHGGSIRAESVYGNGSTFYIELPALFSEEEEIHEESDFDKTLI